MSFSRAFQWYHSHLDLIWPDGTFKKGVCSNFLKFLFYRKLGLFMYFVQHSFICPLPDTTVSQDAWIESCMHSPIDKSECNPPMYIFLYISMWNFEYKRIRNFSG